MENPCKDIYIDEIIGYLPGGTAVYANAEIIARHGRAFLREELVDKEWLRQGRDPPGYHRIRTTPFNSEYVLVYGPTFEQALQKYINRKNKHV